MTLSDFLNQHLPLLFPSPTPAKPQVRNLGYALVSSVHPPSRFFIRYFSDVALGTITSMALTSWLLISMAHIKIQGVLAPFEAEMAWLGACMAGADGWLNVCIGLVTTGSGAGAAVATPRRR